MAHAYYNENDPKAAAWLRELIRENLIAAGDVDERSIENVAPQDLDEYTQHHFFAGIGGWSYALRLAGWPDDRPVWTGSCPCQPFSAAGAGKGLDDERHLWPTWRWLIDQCRPAKIFGEQVASPLGREWLAGVQTDLEALGYDTAAADLCAAGVAAPHIRQRLWWVGDTDTTRSQGRRLRRNEIIEGGKRTPWAASLDNWLQCGDGKARYIESGLEPLVNGLPGRVGLLRGYGNAIVPQVAAVFIECSSG